MKSHDANPSVVSNRYEASRKGWNTVYAFAGANYGRVGFKYAIPFMDSILQSNFAFSLRPWYGLIDGMLVCLTPIFTAMACAFLLLEERDEGIGHFYQITPSAGYAYLAARIGIPMIGALIETGIVMILFNISALAMPVIGAGALVSSLTGVFLAMMVVSMADNRVEGLAFSKLMGVSFLGLLLVWFLPAPYDYFAAFLPSFWIGKLLMGGAIGLSFIMGMLVSLIWTAVFARRFNQRIR